MAGIGDKKFGPLASVKDYFRLAWELYSCQLSSGDEPCDWADIPDRYIELPSLLQKASVANVLPPNRSSIVGRGELAKKDPCKVPSQASFEGHVLELFPGGLVAFRVERLLFTGFTGPVIEENLDRANMGCLFPDIIAGKPVLPEECKGKKFVTRKVVLSQETIDHISAMVIASSIISIPNPLWNKDHIDCFTFGLHTALLPQLEDDSWLVPGNPPKCPYSNERSKEYSELACSNPAAHLANEYRSIDIRAEKAEPGDRIVYLRFRSPEDPQRADNPNFFLPWNTDLSIGHIGIVMSVNEKGIPAEVLSKFGSASHAIMSDPFTNRADYGDIFIIVRHK